MKNLARTNRLAIACGWKQQDDGSLVHGPFTLRRSDHGWFMVCSSFPNVDPITMTDDETRGWISRNFEVVEYFDCLKG